jgi:hypothetical protein
LTGAPVRGVGTGVENHMTKLKIRLESETWIYEEYEQA